MDKVKTLEIGYMLKIMLRLLILFFHNGKIGDTYNVGGLNEWKNIDLIKTIIKIVDRLLKREVGYIRKANKLCC
jgi:dTDP-D-glucose 4,6-dehydratase